MYGIKSLDFHEDFSKDKEICEISRKFLSCIDDKIYILKIDIMALSSWLLELIMKLLSILSLVRTALLSGYNNICFHFFSS